VTNQWEGRDTDDAKARREWKALLTERQERYRREEAVWSGVHDSATRNLRAYGGQHDSHDETSAVGIPLPEVQFTEYELDRRMVNSDRLFRL
jgi:hypothetical protein